MWTVGVSRVYLNHVSGFQLRWQDRGELRGSLVSSLDQQNGNLPSRNLLK